MDEKRPRITADVQRLIDMEDEMILARDIAPIVQIKPDVIIKYAKTGQWDQEHLGKFVISGSHVKFFRKDFLQKCGFLEPEPEKPDVEQLLMEMLEEVRAMRAEMQRIRQCCNTDGDPGTREKGVIL